MRNHVPRFHRQGRLCPATPVLFSTLTQWSVTRTFPERARPFVGAVLQGCRTGSGYVDLARLGLRQILQPLREISRRFPNVPGPLLRTSQRRQQQQQHWELRCGDQVRLRAFLGLIIDQPGAGKKPTQLLSLWGDAEPYMYDRSHLQSTC